MNDFKIFQMKWMANLAQEKNTYIFNFRQTQYFQINTHRTDSLFAHPRRAQNA